MGDTRIHVCKCLLVCQREGGKCSVGGQKRHWNDVIVNDKSVTCFLTGENKPRITGYGVSGS